MNLQGTQNGGNWNNMKSDIEKKRMKKKIKRKNKDTMEVRKRDKTIK